MSGVRLLLAVIGVGLASGGLAGLERAAASPRRACVASGALLMGLGSMGLAIAGASRLALASLVAGGALELGFALADTWLRQRRGSA